MKTVKTIEKAGRQVWLAGLGVALVGREYAAKKLDEIIENGNSVINDMMTKGANVESDIKAVLDGKVKVVDDAKIAELRQKLGLNRETKQDKITRLTAKVDSLSQVVGKLVEQKAKEDAVAKAPAKTEAAPAADAKPAAKPAAKRTTTRKPRATTAKTTTAKASATKSTTAAKPAAKTTTRKPVARKTTAAKTDKPAE